MDYFLKASAVIALFYICFFLFLRKETFFTHNRWFLLVGLAIAIIFPFIVIPIEIIIEPIAPSSNNAVFTENSLASSLDKPIKPNFNWTTLLPLIYGIGLAVFLIQFLFQFGSLIVLLLKNPKNKDGVYTYVIINKKISPFSFFKWIVYNPESFNETELGLMLTHEKIHARQLHSFDLIATQLACTVFWFNPLMWLYRNAIRQNLEFIADSKTQEISNAEKDYQRLLLKTSIGKQEIAFSSTFYNSLIKERIVMLKKSRSSRKSQWRYALMIPLLAGLLMSMNTETVYIQSEEDPEAQKTSKNEIRMPSTRVVFDNSMTDSKLDEIERELESKGIDMSIKRLKRNSEEKISDISITFKTENGSANYVANISEGIESFYFEMKDDGSFGVGKIDHSAVVIVEEIIANDSEKPSKSKSKSFIYNKNEDKMYSIDSTKAKHYNDQRNVIIKRLEEKTMSKDTVYYNAIDSAEIKKLSELKSDLYYQSDQPVSVKNKHVELLRPHNKTYASVLEKSQTTPKQLFIVNGKIYTKPITTLNPNQLNSVSVIKGDEATRVYGEKGKNGVIIIKTKENIDDSPWQVRTEISSIEYIDENDTSKNSSLAYISKYTPDDVLEKNEKLLEKKGLKVKYSRLKRNTSGEITRIKISVRSTEGITVSEGSATYEDDDGIPNIEYGLSEGKVVVRSKS